MKDKVEFVGVIVKVNGKKVIIKKDDCYFHGWEYENEELMESDNGVDLNLTINKKQYKLSL